MIFDLHNDFPTELELGSIEKYISDNSDAIVTAAVWTTGWGDGRAEKTEQTLCRLRELTSVRDFPIAIEDLGFCAAGGVYNEFDFSRLFYCTLTWNQNNAFAGGALSDGELTDDGRRVIALINASGAVVDLAHLNKRSFYSALDCAERVMCSHTGFTDHPRCLDGRQIKALVERNAIIGLSAVGAFSGARTPQEFAEVIDAFVQRYGDGCLAIGTDYFGSKDIPEPLDGYSKLYAVKDCLYSRGYTRAQWQDFILPV